MRFELTYFEYLKPFEFKNIYSGIENSKGPIAIRIDINSPVGKNGRISKNGDVNLRLEEYGYLLKSYSNLGPIILMAHQGRKNSAGEKPDKDYVNLLDHNLILADKSGIRIHFIEHSIGESWEEYSLRFLTHVKHLKKGEAMLMDNVRFWDFEKNYNSKTCPYIPFFKEIEISAFINDAFPVWHRDDASIMFGRHVAPTYIGHISMKELRIQHKIMNDKGKKIIIIGGKKPKFDAIPHLADRMDVLTGGISGILTAQLSGHEVGSANETLLKKVFKGKEKEIKEYENIVNEYKIGHPIDFVISQPKNRSPSNRFTVPVNDLSKPEYEDYEIFDIGCQTVKNYVKQINTGNYDWKIRAGPNGVFEDDFNNGIELIKNILGTGFVAVGGDTVEELQKYELCKSIMYSDGAVLLGGGSHLEGFAGQPYPCIKELTENGNIQ